MKFKGLTIGIPKEIMPGERRVAATPETVEKFIAGGAKVLVEQSAGQGAYFSDDDYKKVGAEVVADAEKVFECSDIILKVKEPLYNSDHNKHEVEMMHAGQTLVTFLHTAAPANHGMVKDLATGL